MHEVKSERKVALPFGSFVTPWTAAHQAPPSMEFARQEYWSGVPLPSLVANLGNDILQINHYQYE